MRDDHPALCQPLAQHIGQAPGDMVIGQAVKAVAQDALVAQRAGQRIKLRQARAALVKGGVETGDLPRAGPVPGHRLDPGEVVGLMPRGQRAERAQLFHHGVGDLRGRRELAPAMDHAMPGTCHLHRPDRVAQHRQQPVDQRLCPGILRKVGMHLLHLSCAMQDETRRAAHAVDQAMRDPGLPILAMQRELHRRRPGIEDQQGAPHQLASPGSAAAASNRASAAEASRAAALSERLVSMIGTRAPSATPAASASARWINCLAIMLPLSRFGATRISARPATSDSIPLAATASGEMALSKANGPSTSPPVIWPRSCILQIEAASRVDGSLAVTVSTADKSAARGISMPSAMARSSAFCTISASAGRSGAMLIAASVMNSMRS